MSLYQKVGHLNWNKGLIRIWAVFSCLWFLIYSFMAASSYYQDLQPQKVENGGRFDDLIPSQHSYWPSDATLELVFISIFVPIGLFILFKVTLVCGAWIYKGFTSSNKSKGTAS